MVLLAAARDLPQDAIPATKSQSGRTPKTTKHSDELLRRELRKNLHLRASELKEMHTDHLGNVSVRCIQNSLQKDLSIPRTLVDNVTKSLDGSNIVISLFIDLKKAFFFYKETFI